MSIFNNNLMKIIAHNNGDETHSLALNFFADLTDEEFKQLYITRYQNDNIVLKEPANLPTDNIPAK